MLCSEEVKAYFEIDSIFFLVFGGFACQYKNSIAMHHQTSPYVEEQLGQLGMLVTSIQEAIRSERDEQTRAIQRAWEHLEMERAALQRERTAFEAEKRAFQMSMERALGVFPTVPIAGAKPAASATSASELLGYRPTSTREDHGNHGSVPLSLMKSSEHSSAVTPNPLKTSLAKQSRAGANALSGGHAFWINVWSGIERNGAMKRLLVPQGAATMQYVLERAARETLCQPAPNVLYTPDGRIVSKLEDIVPGRDYLVLPTGTRYREDTVPTALLEKLVNEPSGGAMATAAESFM